MRKPKNIDWQSIDWSQPIRSIAESLGVSYSCAYMHSPHKGEFRTRPLRKANADLSLPTRTLMDEFGVSRQAVFSARLHKKRGSVKIGRPRKVS